MSNMNPKGFLCSHLQAVETFGAFNYPKSECCNITAPPARLGIQSCVGCRHGACKASLHSSIYYTCIHMHFCKTGIALYPMHAVPCWSSPGYQLVRLRGATQLWSQDHCNYVTASLPPNCLPKPRSHLQDGLTWLGWRLAPISLPCIRW